MMKIYKTYLCNFIINLPYKEFETRLRSDLDERGGIFKIDTDPEWGFINS